VTTTTGSALARDLLATLGLAGGLVALASWGQLPLLVAVAGVQVVLALALLALVDAPAAVGSFVIVVASSVAADVVVVVDDGSVGGLVGVAALAFVASLGHQLVRSHRSRVTESLADTLVVVVVACAAACLPAAVQLAEGQDAVRVSFVSGGVALVVCQLALFAARDGSFGLVTALALAALASLPVAGDLEPGRAAMVGLAAGAAAAIADTLVAVAGVELTDERRRAARAPVALLLPFAVLGPVALSATRLLAQA
jgi:hypothetical protein